ncbi:MAG: hypothetical protein DWH79_05605 [Planctomycetota bacterium]|nr:MAG: hypothetical protein DWH79_05605 [Planctomycetota bacterium]
MASAFDLCTTRTVEPTNPFATRYIGPASLAPHDPAAGRLHDLGGLAARLAILGGSAAIVGAHGSGKSTLLVHLAGRIESEGRPVERIRIRGAAATPDALRMVWRLPRGGVACLDSWEALGAIGRGLVRWTAAWRSVALVVTSHRPLGLPVLVICRTSKSLLAEIVARLPGHDEWYGIMIRDEDVAEAFRHSGGDIRRALDDLYDRFERRRRLIGDL